MDANMIEKHSSSELEMSAIGVIFTNDKKAGLCISQLTEDDFTVKDYRKIFHYSKKCYEENAVIDEGLIYQEMKDMKEDVPSLKKQVLKSVNVTDVKKVESYIEKLKSFTFRRKSYNHVHEILKKINDTTSEDEEIRKGFSDIIEQTSSIALGSAMNTYEIHEKESEEYVNLKTSLKEFQIIYNKGGNGRGQTELVFARPGHGKTFYLFRRAGEFARAGEKGIMFHLEDTKVEAARRVDAVLNPNKFEEENKNILIDTTRFLDDIIQSVRYYHAKIGIKYFTVDHLGRVKVRGYSAKDKNSAMIEVSNRLTDLCSELDMLGMFTVQPRKSYESRKGYENILREEDLKGATEIFEDAFVVTTLFRPNIYPELRLDGKIKDISYKNKGDLTHHYDSVFSTQIKNRRERLTDDMFQWIQHGNILLSEREYRKMSENNSTDEIKTENNIKVSNDDYIPF